MPRPIDLGCVDVMTFEKLNIFEPIDHAATQLEEVRPLAEPAPPLQCARREAPTPGKVDLVEVSHHADFR